MSDRQNTAMSTEASPSGTCIGEDCVSDLLTVTQSCRPGKKAAHLRHVAHGHQVADGRQVEAVHLILHAAGDLAVAAAEVRNHQRRRPRRETDRVSLRLEIEAIDCCLHVCN